MIHIHVVRALPVVTTIVLLALGSGRVEGQILVGYAPNQGPGSGMVAEYSTSDQLLNSSFLSDIWLTYPAAMTLDGNNIFVMDRVNGRIGQFSTSGATLNPAFINTTSGYGLAGDGNGTLYVCFPGSGTIASYSTSGAQLNGSLISGIDEPFSLAVYGNLIYSANFASGTIGEYTTSGTTLNSALISGLSQPQTLAVDGQGNLYVPRGVPSYGENYIDLYSGSGVLLQQSLITCPSLPVSMTISGNDLFIVYLTGGVSEYTTSGTLINSSVATGLPDPMSVLIIPEPSSAALGIFGLAFWLGISARRVASA